VVNRPDEIQITDPVPEIVTAAGRRTTTPTRERDLLSISGCWRRGMDEESFQDDKRAGNGVAA
jgi:hypothetical protein